MSCKSKQGQQRDRVQLIKRIVVCYCGQWCKLYRWWPVTCAHASREQSKLGQCSTCLLRVCVCVFHEVDKRLVTVGCTADPAIINLTIRTTATCCMCSWSDHGPGTVRRIPPMQKVAADFRTLQLVRKRCSGGHIKSLETLCCGVPWRWYWASGATAITHFQHTS